MNLPRQLLAWRRQRELTQEQAAAVLGVTRRAIESWEQGTRAPRGLALRQLQTLLKTTSVRTSGPKRKPE